MSWKYIFNPLLKFSERSLLTVGFLSILAGSFIGHYFSLTFDGAFDAHPLPITFIDSLTENSINILVIFSVLLILGKIIYSKTRFIDILTISMIYRIPIYVSGPLISLPVFDSVANQVLANKENLENIQFETLELISILAASSVLMIFLIYSIVILVNGFRTATNLKKWQYYVFFGVVLIIAEVLSKFLINNL